MSENEKPGGSVSVDADKARSAAEIAAEFQKLRATLPDSISERIRTLCLGSLVVVWGILSGEKGKSNVNVTEGPKRMLLAVALGAVLVLAFDIVEYLFRFEATRQRGGEVLGTSSIDFKRWETIVRWLKVIVGLLALLLLCITLGYLLLNPASTVHAQSNSGNDYLGVWCGGAINEGKYSCLDVRGLSPMESTVNGPHLKVRYSYQSHSWINCFNVQTDQGALRAQCGKGIISAKHLKNSVMGLQIRVGDTNVDSVLFKTK